MEVKYAIYAPRHGLSLPFKMHSRTRISLADRKKTSGPKNRYQDLLQTLNSSLATSNLDSSSSSSQGKESDWPMDQPLLDIGEPSVPSQYDAVRAALDAFNGANEAQIRTVTKMDLYKNIERGISQPLTTSERRLMQANILFGPPRLSSQLRTYGMERPPIRPYGAGPSGIDEHHMIIDRPKPGDRRAVIRTSRGSGLHYVPQVFVPPRVEEGEKRREMILFTENATGVDLTWGTCSITDELYIFPELPIYPNPPSITLELYVRRPLHFPLFPHNLT